jgi:hypothetical protein
MKNVDTVHMVGIGGVRKIEADLHTLIDGHIVFTERGVGQFLSIALSEILEWSVEPNESADVRTGDNA